jgi:hypothetical protein
MARGQYDCMKIFSYTTISSTKILRKKLMQITAVYLLPLIMINNYHVDTCHLESVISGSACPSTLFDKLSTIIILIANR